MRTLLILISMLIVIHADELTFSSGKDNVLHKITSEILEKAYGRMGIETKFIYGGFEESLKLSNSGLTDGEIARLKRLNKKYTELVRVPVVINYMDAIAFSKQDSIEILSWNDLKKYRLGIVRGTQCIEDGTADIPRVIYKSFNELFAALNEGEVDVIVAPKVSGLYIIYKQKYEDIKLAGPSLERVDMYHFLHKKNRELVPKIGAILKNMDKSGELSYIRSTYMKKLTH